MLSRRAFVASPLALMFAGEYEVAQITSPVPNRVFQRDGSGNASFRVTWRGSADSVRLMDGQTQVASSISGVFVDVPSGWYDCELIVSGSPVDTMKIGVGDVYVVAGQSNSVSQRQPETYSMPSIPEGKCIVSDYYRFGSDTFRDLGADSLNASPGLAQAGCAWQHCAAALNRDWPVMFVLIGKGNTTYYEWAYKYVQELFAAWAIYRPKAVLWHQGESECTTPPRTDSYTMLNACVESLRNVTVTPVVIALNSTSYPPPEGYGAWPVRAAQQQVIANWAHVHTGPDTDTIRNAGEVEFLGSDLQAHGELWATRLTQLNL